MPAVIEVDHVTKEFQLGQLTSLGQSVRNGVRRLRGLPVEERAPFKALDDVSFAVNAGEVVGIIGHNGAGKSTLLKMLANISRPTRGAVRIGGRIAPLIEVGAGFVPEFTGRENVYLNASILGMSRAEIKRKFDEIVDFAEMAEFIDTPVKRYSSGMQVKLAFAVATSIEAEILIVDEVLAVGDLAFQRKCFDRMEELIKRQHRTVLLVSHNIRQVERLCSRVIVMDHGRKVVDGSAVEGCNHYYENSDQRVLENIAKEKRKEVDRRGGVGAPLAESDVLRLDEVVLLARDGRALQQITYREPVTLRLRMYAQTPLQEIAIGVGLHTPDLLYVANDDSILAPKGVFSVSEGTFVVEYHIDAFPIFPGTYSLRLGIAYARSDQVLFYAENISHLHVVAGDVSRSRLVGQGFFSLNGQWEFNAQPAVGGRLTTNVAPTKITAH